ncbi:MAG: transcriptional regulator [Cyclobacteriaceae bacterium]
MGILKYKIIKSKSQYNQYCKTLEELVDSSSKRKAVQDEIDLLTLLIEKYDAEHNTFAEVEPVVLLKSLMADHNMKAEDLVNLLGYISDILHYKKGLSNDVIRKLSERFKVKQEAFNRPYKLKSAHNVCLREASLMNTAKKMVVRNS